MTTETINIIVKENGARVVKRNLDRLGRTALTTNSSVSILSRSLLGLTGGLSAAIGIRSFITTLANFSQALSTVEAITGATTKQFIPLEAEIKRLGATTRFTATQAAEGAQFLARAGFNAIQVTESLASTLILAQSTATEFGRAADIVTNIMTAFQIETTETARVGDVLSKATNRSNTNLSQLGDAMKFVAPIARGLNIEIEETVALISTLSDAGLQGSIAGTGLRRVMTELEVAARKQGKTLKELGIQQDATTVSVVGLVSAIQALEQAGFDTGQAMEFFGQRGGPAFENISNAIPKVKEMTESLKNSEGFMKRVAAVMDDNLNGAILAVRSAVEALVIAIGDSGGFSILTTVFRGLAAIIRFVARNIDILAAAFQTLVAVKVIEFVTSFIARNKALAASIVAGNTVLLDSVSIEAAKAASSLRVAETSLAASAAKVRELQVGVAQLQQNRTLLLQQQAGIVIDNQRRVARDALTGRFIAFDAAVAQNIRTNRALNLTEQSLVSTKAQLATAMTAQTTATGALSAAQTRNAAAAAASNTASARLARTFPLLAGVIGAVTGAFRVLNAVIRRNPIVFLITVIFTLITAFNSLAKKIKFGEDKIVSLRDIVVAAFQIVMEAIAPFVGPIWDFISSGISRTIEGFKTFGTSVLQVVGEVGKLLFNTFTFIPRVAIATISGLIKVFQTLPEGVDNSIVALKNAFIGAFEAITNAGINAINFLIRNFNSFFSLFGGDKAAKFFGISGVIGEIENTKFDRIESKFDTSGKTIGGAFADGFSSTFEAGSADSILGRFNSFADKVAGRAEVVAQNRIKNEETTTPDSDPPGGGSSKTFSQELADLQQKIALEKQFGLQKQINNKIISIESSIKRQLNATEKEQIANAVNLLEISKIQGSVLEELRGPREKFIQTQAALNELFEKGKISVDEYTRALRKAEIQSLRNGTSLQDGVKKGLLTVQESFNDVASLAEKSITNAFSAAEDSMVSFFQTGKLGFSDLVDSIQADLTRLAVRTAITGPLSNLINPGEGGGGGLASLFGGGEGGGLGSLFGMNNGGTVEVGGNGGIDNNVLSVNDTPVARVSKGETVNVTPRGQGNERPMVINFNISTPDANSFRKSQDQILARAQAAMRRADQRNN